MAAAAILFYTYCCLCFTFRPILINFGGNVTNPMSSACGQSINITTMKIQDGGCRHLEFRITVAISLLFDHTSPNSMGILLIQYRTQSSSKKEAKRYASKMAAAAILNFRKVWSFHYYPTKPRQIYRERCKFDVERIACVKGIARSQKTRWRLPPSSFYTYCFLCFTLRPILIKFGGNVTNPMLNAFGKSRNITTIKIQDGGCPHFKFRNTVAISILLDQSSQNLTWILQIRLESSQSRHHT